MTTTTTPPTGWEPQGNPLLGQLAILEAAVDQAATGNPVFLTTGEKSEAIVRLLRLRDRLDGLALSVLAHAEDVAAEQGTRNPAAWLAHQTQTDYPTAAATTRLGEALARWHQVADALATGLVSTAQAHAIVAALDALPADVDPATLAKAEAHLIGEAAHHTPRQLRILGRKVLEVLAPEAYDDHERRLLEAEEARARRRLYLIFRPRHDGTTDLRGRLPDQVAERLRTYLEAFTSPRQSCHHSQQEEPDPAPTGPTPHPRAERPRPYSQQLGEAFCSLFERLPANLLPQHGGSATTLVVTINHDQLREDLGAAQLATGGRISAGQARRLACTANILPAVLGSGSQVLDLGRTTRLFTNSQRIAMGLRDRECRAEGCTIPAAWCEAHHLTQPWATGGRTDLADGALLCSHHHHLAHNEDYHQHILPNRQIRFRPRRT